MPPVGDTSVYDGGCLLFDSIENFVVLKKHRQVGESEEKLRFVRYLLHCQQVTMDEADWELLQTRFFKMPMMLLIQSGIILHICFMITNLTSGTICKN